MASATATTLIRRGLRLSPRRLGDLGPSAQSGGHEGGYKFWRNLFFLGALPMLGLVHVHCYLAHVNQPHERPPFVKYEYLRLRSKRFPWGDGSRSLFHNPHVNPLPDGYEDEEEDEH